MDNLDRFFDYDHNHELYHHGILGMKWGVRRYQNPDGSLTDAGSRRYGSGKSIGQRIKDYKTAKTRQKNLKKARAARVEKKKEEERQAKVNAERQKLIKAGKLKAKDMTNDELEQHIRRLENEKRLNQLQAETATKGQKFVKTVLDKVVTPAATSAGEQFLRKYLSDVGDDILGGIRDAKAKKDPGKRLAAENEKLKSMKTNLELKRDIKNIKTGTKSLDDEVKDWKNKRQLEYLKDDKYQELKRKSEKSGFYKKINDSNYDWSNEKDIKDEDNNGFDDDEEEKEK